MLEYRRACTEGVMLEGASMDVDGGWVLELAGEEGLVGEERRCALRRWWIVRCAGWE